MGSSANKIGEGEALLEEGEALLARGDSAAAYDVLTRATGLGVPPNRLHRLAAAYALAGRFQNRHAEVLDWIEGTIETADDDVGRRASLLRARVAVCRQLDLNRVGDLAEEALAAADAAGDERAYASVLSHAAFAGYRRGDVRAAQEFAERAATRTFTSAAAHYDAVRAQIFCATSLGDLEAALNYATKARAMARELDRPADVANESNNLSEIYLGLGYPAEALHCASAAVELARESGHTSVEGFGHVLIAEATAEVGHIDKAIEQFRDLGAVAANRIFAVDAAAAYAYWLLDRGAAGDAGLARQIAEEAAAGAEEAGVANRLTGLYAAIARAFAREGAGDEARRSLEQARKAADRGEPRTQALLALAVAEVLPVSASKRKVALQNARARILRSAARREDPRAFCTRVRLHRRLLELSGGVPDDLPAAE
jgi:hypothetical protein